MSGINWRRHLTPRERQIVEAVSRGLLNKQIANELHVTEATVKFHLGNVYRKLGVVNRTQLVAHTFGQTAEFGQPAQQVSRTV